MSKCLIMLVVFFVFGAAVFAQARQTSESDIIRIDSAPSSGFSYPYYLHIPPEVRNRPANERSSILVLPNNTGKVDDDFAVHEADVKRRMGQVGVIASLLKVAVLMPVFPRPKSHWKIYTQALDRDSMVTDMKLYKRLDLQLVAMIDDCLNKFRKDGMKFDRRVLINGFSAQGMFANRFTFLHPDRVKAAVIGSPGGWPIAPVGKYQGKKLRYPIGVSDLRAVSGEKLALGRLRKIPMLVFLGDQDTNDSVPFDDSFDQEDRDLINPLFGKTPLERWEVSKSLYMQARLKAEFKLYHGVGHTVSMAKRDDIRAFLQRYSK